MVTKALLPDCPVVERLIIPQFYLVVLASSGCIWRPGVVTTRSPGRLAVRMRGRIYRVRQFLAQQTFQMPISASVVLRHPSQPRLLWSRKPSHLGNPVLHPPVDSFPVSRLLLVPAIQILVACLAAAETIRRKLLPVLKGSCAAVMLRRCCFLGSCAGSL